MGNQLQYLCLCLFIVVVFVFVFVFAFVIVFGGRYIDIPLRSGLWMQSEPLRGLMAKLTVQPATDKGGKQLFGGGASRMKHPLSTLLRRSFF